MIKKFLFFRLYFFIIILFSYSFAMAYEEPSFKIVHQTDKYEIRHYQERLAVQSTYTNQNSSFRNLFNYISGANKDSQKIKMTTPVTQYDNNSEIVMQFYLPSKYTTKTAPIPSDPRVTLINIEEGYYAVIRYSGNARDKNFDKHAQILRTSLIEDKVQILGPSIKAIYNGPFTLPIMRRNEAMFKVEWKKL